MNLSFSTLRACLLFYLFVRLYMFFSRIISERPASTSMTFGYRRSRVVGALANGIFLLALCFTILLDTIKRFVAIEEVSNPKMLVIVASIGLLVNIVGLFLFGGHHHHHHHHDHHDHSHSHDGHDDDDHVQERSDFREPIHSHEHDCHHHHHHHHHHESPHSPAPDNFRHHHDPESTSEHGESLMSSSRDELISSGDSLAHYQSSESKSHNHHHDHHDHGHGHGDMNIKGVFLHVLGDALGSIAAIIGGLCIWLFESEDRYYADPVISLFITIIIAYGTWPMVVSSSKILMQGVPLTVDYFSLCTKLKRIPDVIGIHCFHVWQLDEETSIATCHLALKDHTREDESYRGIIQEVTSFLHRSGIHSTTIQPEFIGDEEIDSSGAASEENDHSPLLGCRHSCSEECPMIGTCCSNSDVELSPHAQPSSDNHSIRLNSV